MMAQGRECQPPHGQRMVLEQLTGLAVSGTSSVLQPLPRTLFTLRKECALPSFCETLKHEEAQYATQHCLLTKAGLMCSGA